MATLEKSKSLESWIWDAACSIRGAKDAPKYKDYILPLIFTKRLCDVFDDELNRIAKEVGSRKKAFQLVKADHKLVRFYLPLVQDDPEQPVWSVIRKLSDKIGEGVTSHMRAIARENPLLQGIIDRVDFNATTHGQRDLDDDRLSNLIEAISTKRLGLDDVEADLIESVLYLPEKLFYNTTAPGIVLFLNKSRDRGTRRGKVLMVNASQVFENGDPRNFIPDAGIQRLAETLIEWQEEEKLSRIVEHTELKKNDYNFSPSRYIHTSNAETYRPIAEIVEELKVIEAEVRETDKALQKILKQLGVSA